MVIWALGYLDVNASLVVWALGWLTPSMTHDSALDTFMDLLTGHGRMTTAQWQVSRVTAGVENCGVVGGTPGNDGTGNPCLRWLDMFTCTTYFRLHSVVDYRCVQAREWFRFHVHFLQFIVFLFGRCVCKLCCYIECDVPLCFRRIVINLTTKACCQWPIVCDVVLVWRICYSEHSSECRCARGMLTVYVVICDLFSSP